MSSKNNKISNETSSLCRDSKKNSKVLKKKKRFFNKGAKKETSMLLAVVMIMALSVPVIMALLEFFGVYFR